MTSSLTCRATVALAAALCLTAPRLAAAQAGPEDDPRTSARMHVGPFYLTPAVTLSNLGVDTNVFNQSGEPQSDFTFSLAPQADVWLPVVRRALLQFTGVVGMDYFRKFDSESSINPDLTGRGELYLNRLTVFGEGSYLNTRQRPSYEIDARARRTEDGFGGGFEIRTLPKLYLELSGSRMRIRFDADAFFDGTSLQQTLNRDTTSGSFAVKWRWSPLTTFVGRATVATDRFLYSADRNADSLSGTFGVELRPRAVISGSGHVGVKRFTGLGDAMPDYQGAVARASLSYNLLGSTLFVFTADRDVAFSYEGAQPYYVRAGYGLTIRRQIAGHFDASAGATRYTYTYKEFLGTAAPGPERVDRIWNYTGSVGYRVGRDVRIGVGASYYDRSSESKSSIDFNGLRVGLLVEYGTR